MSEFVKKYGKYIAIIIVISILASVIPMFLNEIKLNQVRAWDDESEMKIAADISNMTGVKVEEIMKLRGYGITWNEVLNKVKLSTYKKDDKDRRENALTEDVLGEEYVEELEKEGFSKDKILDAKMKVERLSYNLKEITSQNDVNVIIPKVEISIDNKEKDKDLINSCAQILEKIDIKSAVSLMIKLEKDFGSVEKVLDEYLLSLQLEISLEEYLKSPKEYENLKSQKSFMGTDNIITLAKIEDLLLKKIQTEGKKQNEENTTKYKASSNKDSDIKSPLPENPLPEVKDVKPLNPVNEIMNEVQIIDPMKNGGK